jgi:amino acid adenylation domain-containing protein
MQRIPVGDQFDLMAQAAPDAIAIDAPDGCVSYVALSQWAASITTALRTRGIVGKGAIVGLLLPSSTAYVAALLGVSRAGAAFMPLDPTSPPARLARQIETAGPVAIVVDEANEAAVPTGIARILVDAGRSHDVEHARFDAAVPRIGPADPAYVMFTSGSTGAPKAVLGQHRGLTHFLRWELAEFGLDATVRGSWLAPTTFDVSLRDILVPLMAGGTLCIPDETTRLTPHRLLSWLADRRVNLVHCVPTMLRLLTRAQEDARGAGATSGLPDLRHLLVAGEKLLAADVAAWRREAGDAAAIVNLYGPTETTLAKLFHRVGALPDDPRTVLPIGRPLPDTEVVLLKSGRLCQPGQIGEIHIATTYRTLGYLNDPERTAAVFVADPVGIAADGVLYRTGDLGRRLRDGTVECLGRVDGQVKIGGVRIEPGEIEAALRTLPGIGDAVVVAHDGAGTAPTLVAYYTGRDGEPPALDGVRAGLSDVLPAALLPRIFMPLDELPRTVSGKVDRRALPRPEALFYERHEYVAPETATERRLAAIWSELFGMERIGVTTGFTELGGDSLKAIHALGRVYQECGVEIPIDAFFTGQTIRALAALLDASAARKRPEPIPHLPDAPFHACSIGQERLWTLDRMEGGSARYNLAEAYLLTGPVDAPRLESALAGVIRRHDALRAGFPEREGRPMMVVAERVDWRLECLDRPDADDAELEALAAEHRAHVFDLTRPPLLRATLVRVRPAEDGTPCALFLFCLHHIVGDVASLAILVEEIAAAWRGGPEPAPLETRFVDFAAWQRARLTGGSLAAERAFWTTKLAAPLPVLDLPADRPRPPVQTFNGTTQRLVLDADVAAALREAARETSLFSVLTALTRALLHRLTGQTDIILGTPLLGRAHPALRTQIGYHANTVALRGQIDPNANFGNLARKAAEDVRAALTHQDYPFDALLSELDLPRDLSRSPVFDAMLVLQNFENVDLVLDGVGITPFGPRNAWEWSRCDAVFHFAEEDGALILDLNHNSDLFDPARMRRVTQQFQQLAREALAAPNRPIGSLGLLPPDEAAELARFAEGAVVPREAATIVDLLAEQTTRRPTEPAIVDGARVISFAALWEASGRIAGALRTRGVAPGETVGVLAGRGGDPLLALVGILRAGAVYVPIDADYPAVRVARMATDANCRLLLTEAMDWPGAIRIADLCDAPAAEPLGDGPVPDDLAYIIFTSGSTGVPKGVEVAHRGFVNMSLGQIAALGLGADDRVLQFASPSFDASLANIFMAWFAGGAVVTVPTATIGNTELLRRHLLHTGTTVATLPPSYLTAMGTEPLGGLRVLITAGEPAPVAALCSQAAAGIRAFNAYGPTETSVCATMHAVSATEAERPRLPIGRPLPNLTVRVVDAEFSPMPIGVPGEIVVGGIGVARGYRGDEARTAERFVIGPDGTRWYRTGDLGCWLEDGTLDYLGRVDEQLKINGNRIEPSEVARPILATPGVANVHVGAINGADGRATLAAWYVPRTRPELFPSVSEFYVYDEVLHGLMAADDARNQRYAAAFARALPGRVVLEIGPGPTAILARMAIAAGARKVYAVELLERSWRAARETVEQLGLADRIIVLHGDAATIELPEPADVCISEIVGNIGGSEGAARIINRARRLLRDGSQMLPRRSLTLVAGLALPETELAPGFDPQAADYVDAIFQEVGRPFDLRLCVRHLPADAIVTSAAPLEDLDFTAPLAEQSEHTIALTATRAATLTGFVAWLRLFVDDDNVLDTIAAPGSWLPVIIPAFPDGVALVEGDQILAVVTRTLSETGRTPDFTIEGVVRRVNAPDLRFVTTSRHHGEGFRVSPFHRRLFADGSIPRRADLAVSIRENLAAVLPAHAVPTHLIAVEALPVTPSGKVDRSALPAPVLTRAAPRAPRSEIEDLLLTVWRGVLGRDVAGIDDDFFAAGGDSIRAIQIVSRLHQAGWKAEIRDVMHNPTVAGLAARLRPLAAIASPSGPVEGPVPLAPIQRWFLDRAGTAANRFDQAVLLRFNGPTDPAAIAACIDLLWRSHDQLRARFTGSGDAIWQHIAAPTTPADFTVLDMADIEAAATSARPGFDLEHGPLFVARLFRGGDRDALLLSAHHLVVDAFSWRILIDDFAAAYAVASAGGELRPRPRGASFRDHAAMLESLAAVPAAADRARFWRDFDPPAWPTGLRSDAIGTAVAAASRHIVLDADATACLARDRGASQEEVLLAALGDALRDEFGGRRILVDIESHGREAPVTWADFPTLDLGRTVGWFTSFHPAVMPLTGASPAERIMRVRDALASVPDRGRGYLPLVYGPHDFGVARRCSPIGFNYLGALGGGLDGASFGIDWDAPGSGIGADLPCFHPIEVLAMIEDGSMRVTLTCDLAAMASEVPDRLRFALEAALRRYAARTSTSSGPGFSHGIDGDELDALIART